MKSNIERLDSSPKKESQEQPSSKVLEITQGAKTQVDRSTFDLNTPEGKIAFFKDWLGLLMKGVNQYRSQYYYGPAFLPSSSFKDAVAYREAKDSLNHTSIYDGLNFMNNPERVTLDVEKEIHYIMLGIFKDSPDLWKDVIRQAKHAISETLDLIDSSFLDEAQTDNQKTVITKLHALYKSKFPYLSNFQFKNYQLCSAELYDYYGTKLPKLPGNLKSLIIQECPNLESLDGLTPNVVQLDLYDVGKNVLSSIPEWIEVLHLDCVDLRNLDTIASITNLKSLSIGDYCEGHNCNWLRFIPLEQIEHLSMHRHTFESLKWNTDHESFATISRLISENIAFIDLEATIPTSEGVRFEECVGVHTNMFTFI